MTSTHRPYRELDFGGDLSNIESKALLTNVAFIGTLASLGGWMYNDEADIDLMNVTFAANSAKPMGGALHNDDSPPILSNCPLWDNAAPLGAQMHNNIESEYPRESNIDADPQFGDLVPPDQDPTTAGNYLASVTNLAIGLLLWTYLAPLAERNARGQIASAPPERLFTPCCTSAISQ